jgi:hypothetical protein
MTITEARIPSVASNRTDIIPHKSEKIDIGPEEGPASPKDINRLINRFRYLQSELFQNDSLAPTRKESPLIDGEGNQFGFKRETSALINMMRYDISLSQGTITEGETQIPFKRVIVTSSDPLEENPTDRERVVLFEGPTVGIAFQKDIDESGEGKTYTDTRETVSQIDSFADRLAKHITEYQ